MTADRYRTLLIYTCGLVQILCVTPQAQQTQNKGHLLESQVPSISPNHLGDVQIPDEPAVEVIHPTMHPNWLLCHPLDKRV